MATTCAQCGASLADGARFCGQCGTLTSAGSAGQVGAGGSGGSVSPPQAARFGASTMLNQAPLEAAPMTVPDPTAALAAFAATPDAGVPAVAPPSFPSSSSSSSFASPASQTDPRFVPPPPPVSSSAAVSVTFDAPASAASTTAPMVPAIAPAASVAAHGKQTMMGLSVADAALSAARAQVAQAAARAPEVAAAPAPPAQPPPNAAPGSGLGARGGRTMIGVAFPGLPPAGQPAPQAQAFPQAPPQAQPQPQAQAQPQARGDLRGGRGQQTMLGVAIPGIAPTASAPVAPAPAPAPPAPSPAVQRPGATMIGVAIPGIAPAASAVGAPPPSRPQAMDATQLAPVTAQAQAMRAAYGAPFTPAQPPAQHYAPGPPGGAPPGYGHAPVPPHAAPDTRPVRSKLQNTAMGTSPFALAPAPFVDDVPEPEAPRRRKKRGVPIGVVAAIVGGLVLLGGGAIALLYRGPPPITAQPRLDPQNNEILHLHCGNCPDGTVAALDGAKATFHGGDADLALAKALDVGENKLAVQIDRPASGRDESVSLVVPVAFRIRADLADIGAKPPIITVRVAATAGTDITVDGKPLALDASGHGAYAVDVSADTEGATEELRVIDRKIPYAVTLKGGKPEAGVVTARIAVAPLRLDAPSTHAVIDTARFAIAGQTLAGGAVTIDEKPAPTQPDGSFADARDASAGDTSVEIRATAPGRAPRTAHVTVKRVTSLDAEAKAAESAGPLLTYDQVAPDVGSKVGQRAVVSGEVLEARLTGHQTIALVNDVRGCASGPCLVRVIASEDAKILVRGAGVRAYGRVTRPVTTTAGKTIPEMEADFVVRGVRDKGAR